MNQIKVHLKWLQILNGLENGSKSTLILDCHTWLCQIIAILNAHWVNSIAASGRCNRSLPDHNDINVAEGRSNETFAVSSTEADGMKQCYNAEASANNGIITQDGNEIDGKSLGFDFDCQYPSEIIFCGEELCGLIEFESNHWARENSHHSEENKSSDNASAGHRGLWLLLGVVPIIIACKVYWTTLRSKMYSLLDSIYHGEGARAVIGATEVVE